MNVLATTVNRVMWAGLNLCLTNMWTVSFTTKVVLLTPSVFNLDCGLGRCFPEEHWLLFLDGQQPRTRFCR